jgi:hypothetical protein
MSSRAGGGYYSGICASAAEESLLALPVFFAAVHYSLQLGKPGDSTAFPALSNKRTRVVCLHRQQPDDLAATNRKIFEPDHIWDIRRIDFL